MHEENRFTINCSTVWAPNEEMDILTLVCLFGLNPPANEKYFHICGESNLSSAFDVKDLV